MSLELKISMDQLKDPRVAETLADLIRALGGGTTAKAGGNGRRRGAKPAAPKLTWEQLLATLTPQTQEFLRLLEGQGKVTMAQAVKALKLRQNKSMGGLTGALSRKARGAGVALPYHQAKNKKGERIWVWGAAK